MVGAGPESVGCPIGFRIGLLDGDIISAWSLAIFGATNKVLGALPARRSESPSEISETRESMLDGKMEGDVSSLRINGTSIASDGSALSVVRFRNFGMTGFNISAFLSDFSMFIGCHFAVCDLRDLR